MRVPLHIRSGKYRMIYPQGAHVFRLHIFAVLISLAFATGATASPVPASAIPPETPAAEALPLGTLFPADATEADCPPGFACSGFEVTCPGVTSNAPGYIAIGGANASSRGLVVFFTGGSGMGWWSGRNPDLLAFTDELRSRGYTIVQVRWGTNWLESSPGNTAGTSHLACRPATVIHHIHDTIYAPLELSPAVGECGFCITGNSGGATQSGYALSHYGLETILDGVFPTGGPPHSVMAKSCLGEEGYGYQLDTREFLDRGFGFFDGQGPCARQDPSYTSRWNEESVSTGGSDYYHPQTRIHFICGERDLQMQIVGGDYVARLRSAGTPFISVSIAPDTPHNIRTPEGLELLKQAILGAAASPSRRRPARLP